MSGLISSGKTLRVQEFRTSGTWTNPGVKTARLFAVAAGGGSNGSGGQGGQIFKGPVDVAGVASCAVVIGAGTAADGGDTSFNGVVVAHGGKYNGGSTNGVGIATVGGEDGFGGHGGYTLSYYTPSNGATKGVPHQNSGAGASNNGSANDGASGYLRVEWEE